MSTRTSIRIGTILDSSMKEKLPGYERVLEEYTYQYLLFGYRKAILGHYYATVLFQASKTFGGITCEVGLSRIEEYPYYRFYDSPSLGVHGFRSRTTHVLKGLEATTTRLYSGPDVLLGHILDLVSEAITAGNKLIEETVPRVAEQYALWQPLYEEWVEAEKNAKADSELRYPNLVGEKVARDILHDCLRSGRFDSFLGPKKFSYRDQSFLNCHVFLIAKALGFVIPPEDDEITGIEIDPQQDPDKILFDAIGAISGRSEQPEAIELSPRIIERVPQWAFLRSFAALEALFDRPMVKLSDVTNYVKQPEAKRPEVKPVGMSLDDLYSDTSSAAAAGVNPTLVGQASQDNSVTGYPAVEAQPAKRIRFALGKHRMDPFEMFLPYLGQASPAKEPDHFDLLGSQLGI